MSITVGFESFEKFESWLTTLSGRIKIATRDTSGRLTKEAEKIAKERIQTPSRKPGKGTGAYFQSIHSDLKDGSSSFTGSLKSESPIAGIIEFGSPPHIIRPKGNKLLFWPGARHPVKEVKHPGTPAFRVLGDAVEDAALQTMEKFEQALKKHFVP